MSNGPTVARVRIALASLMLVGCQLGAGDPRLLAGHNNPSAELRTNCALTERRCSRCHPLGRIQSAQVTTEAHWRSYVTRMRLMPASGIRLTEVEPIVRCLVTIKSPKRSQ